MLRVGLTGDLGSGKSTVAAMLAQGGAIVLSSDEMARAMMQPGQPLHNAIVSHFGPSIVAADGSLDRRKLAGLAFDPAAPRVDELNALVHPAVLAAQAEAVDRYVTTRNIVVVESALIFSAYGQTPAALAARFDCILLVSAPEAEKVSRFIQRAADGQPLSGQAYAALEADARRRLALQDNESHTDECLVIQNNQGLDELREQVALIWDDLNRREQATKHPL